MWPFNTSSAVLGLVALTVLPGALAKPYPVHVEELRELHNATQIVKRACENGGTLCGWEGRLCCKSGESCYTDSNNQAQCGASGQATQGDGSWQYSTTTWVETVGLTTYTSVYSQWAPATATAGSCSDSQSPCGGICCDSGMYCKTAGTCVVIAGGSSGGILPSGPLSPSAPLRPTSSGVVIVTYTGSPTATVPFQTPIATGASATGGLTEAGAAGGGLSGGAIAGIVIGVILGILLLLLLCLFCCARALFDTMLAIFGFGKKRKHTHEETYIEEHHHSAAGGASGGRWYGQGRPSRPSRPGTHVSEKPSSAKKGLGVAAALGGMALALGLKRKADNRHDDKSTTISGSSYIYSDYTSSSSASSSDRNTRRTRHSSRR